MFLIFSGFLFVYSVLLYFRQLSSFVLSFLSAFGFLILFSPYLPYLPNFFCFLIGEVWGGFFSFWGYLMVNLVSFDTM